MAGHDDRPPSCITAALQAQYAACPSVQVATTPAPICAPAEARRPPIAAPDDELVVDSSLKPEDPRLDPPEQLVAQAERAQDEQSWRRAERAFQASARGLRGTPAFGFASYRLAHLLHRRGDHEGARDALAETIVFAMARAALPADRALAERARRDFVWLFARHGDPELADEVFTSLTPFRKTAPMLADLAAQLAAMGNTAALGEVMEQLALRDPDHRCSHRAHILDLARARGDRRSTVEALNALLDAYDQLDVHERDKNACGVEAARHLLELAEQWRTSDIDLAEQLYRRILATFTQEQLAGWGHCVDLADISRHRGDLLDAQGRWRECGTAYDDALRLAPGARWATAVAYAAVVCRERAWSKGQAEREDMPTDERIARTLEHTEDWRRMLASFHRYLCTSGGTAPPADRAETSLARARAFFEGGALWESAVGFRVVAFGSGEPAIRREAMQRYAEITEALAMDDTCRIELRDDLDQLMARHCDGADGAAGECTQTHDVWRRLEPQQL